MKVTAIRTDGFEGVNVTAGRFDLGRLAHMAQDTARDGKPRQLRVEASGRPAVEVGFEREEVNA